MNKKIRFAVIGCGHIGKRHAEMITRDEGAELVALCDIRPKEELGIEAYAVPFARKDVYKRQPVMRETKHWYLPLDKWEPFLRKWILEDHKEWKPNVYGQCKSWLDMGLQPLSLIHI